MEGIDLNGNSDRTERSYWTSREFLIFLAFGAMAPVPMLTNVRLP
jgi:hypothetical protein